MGDILFDTNNPFLVQIWLESSVYRGSRVHPNGAKSQLFVLQIYHPECIGREGNTRGYGGYTSGNRLSNAFVFSTTTDHRAVASLPLYAPGRGFESVAF